MGAPRRTGWLVAAVVAALLLLTLVLWWPRGSSDGDTVALQPAPIAPETVDTDSGTSAGTVEFGAAELFSLLWRFALVGVAMAAAVAGLRWWTKRAASPRSTTGLMRVVDTLAVGNGRTIHLLALGERVLVVGATAQTLTYLTELDESTARRVLEGEERRSFRFSRELLRSLGRAEGERPPFVEVRS